LQDTSERERLWELERAVRELSLRLPMSAPEVLILAEEADAIINRMMGIAGVPQGGNDKVGGSLPSLVSATPVRCSIKPNS